MQIIIHGGLFFTYKSHAHLQSNLTFSLQELGNHVTICRPVDTQEINIYNRQHLRLAFLCRDDHIYTDHNIWTTSRATEFKEGGHKFDCFLHSDGHYNVSPEEYKQWKDLPFNYYLRGGLDAAQTIANQFGRPTYGLYDNGYNRHIFNKEVPAAIDFGNNFVFMLTSQNLFNSELRGTDLAINAFLNEFDPKEPVRLVLKIAQEHEQVRVIEQRHKNMYYDSTLSSFEDLARLYSSVNCMLSPIRGAMWENPIMQAMACGIPAIATNAGGPALYIKDGETGYLLPYQWSGEGCTLQKEPDVMELRRIMRYAYEHPTETKEMGRIAAEDIKTWNYEFIAKKFVEFLQGSMEFVKMPEERKLIEK